ncbi:disco-interacting protein 2 homolog C-like isoform X3 [Hemibagrus wyckioides]|nr:disco-interacting protein 2 homolog C-like isoform X3 [Hemibagrus wyckioides]
MAHERRPPMVPSSASRYHRRRSSGTRDERYRSDVHTEAVQAALAKHKERKVAVPMPSKRRSLVVQTSMDAYTPPGLSPLSSLPPLTDTSSGSEEEGLHGEGTPTSSQGSASMEHWISRAIHHGSTTSSSSSSTQSGGSGAAGCLADVLAQTHMGKPGPIAHLSLKRKTMLGVAENGNSLRRSCEFGSDLLWPPPLESDGQYAAPAFSPPTHTHTPMYPDPLHNTCPHLHHKTHFTHLHPGHCVCVCVCVL